ncbi:MAG TPA: molybdopterin-dependent oxidoreductase [Ilumatobacteraceae bacterium]|nr:molybdopterin-dependent oxidoreductase [Ilumatobacteraceae bacterium]HRB03839.1 molybdopterin-dependent oxidoreductase [Ilumatobacteraceae bacterium]
MPTSDTTESSTALPGRLAAISSGLLAGAAALALGELAAGFAAKWQSPVVSVAEAVIDAVPRSVKEFAIETFGENDKIALVVGILSFSVVFAAILGLLGRRRPWIPTIGFAAFAAVGVWASQTVTGAPLSAVIPSVLAGVAGAGTYHYLHQLATPRAVETDTIALDSTHQTDDDPAAMAAATPGTLRGAGTSSRRRFLIVSGAVAAGAALAATAGRALRARFDATASRNAVVLPTVAEPLPAAPTTVSAQGPGISPFYTPNNNFYRVDTALAVPQVRTEEWELKVTGMVDTPLRFSFDELLKRNLVEEDITLTCVSNPVGGQLTGTARWLGLPLSELLDEAGVQSGADQIVGRSVDGWTGGFPLEAAFDRPALVAIGMNGEPLPIEHGFPARLLVPGLYGYTSATKWLTEIELTRFADFDQYWVKRGWDQKAPIKTMARIDAPRTLAKVPAGPFVIGGVAWAQTVGISKVEVAIDGGDFVEADLADELNENTWRQWRMDWDAPAGRHRITVRATDANGELQTDQRAEPFPNGASGWMSIFVDVV